MKTKKTKDKEVNDKTKSKSFNIFKIKYYWYEGEEEESLVGKYVEREEFEKDLMKPKKFAKSLIGKKVEGYNYLGKGYSVECLPEYYSQIIWFLTNRLGYIDCYLDSEPYDSEYIVSDMYKNKIILTRQERDIKNKELK